MQNVYKRLTAAIEEYYNDFWNSSDTEFRVVVRLFFDVVGFIHAEVVLREGAHIYFPIKVVEVKRILELHAQAFPFLKNYRKVHPEWGFHFDMYCYCLINRGNLLFDSSSGLRALAKVLASG